MKTILTILIILIVLGAGFFYFHQKTPTPTYETPNTYQTPVSTASMTDMIHVTSPTAGTLAKSPLTVTGEARGNWYFEASFPIKVLDANGKVLGSVAAQAQGDWMTTDFVPFRAIVSFSTSTTYTGTLVLEKDNPSDLPQNAAEVRIPIRFR